MNDFLNENQTNNEEEVIKGTLPEEPQETIAEEPQETVADENPQSEDFSPMGNLQYNPVTFTDIVPETGKKSST